MLAAMDSCFGRFWTHQHGIASKQAQVPKKNIYSTVDVMNKHGLSAQYRGFKLATSTFVLSTLDADLYCHIPQELHFHYI